MKDPWRDIFDGKRSLGNAILNGQRWSTSQHFECGIWIHLGDNVRYFSANTILSWFLCYTEKDTPWYASEALRMLQVSFANLQQDTFPPAITQMAAKSTITGHLLWEKTSKMILKIRNSPARCVCMGLHFRVDQVRNELSLGWPGFVADTQSPRFFCWCFPLLWLMAEQSILNHREHWPTKTHFICRYIAIIYIPAQAFSAWLSGNQHSWKIPLSGSFLVRWLSQLWSNTYKLMKESTNLPGRFHSYMITYVNWNGIYHWNIPMEHIDGKAAKKYHHHNPSYDHSNMEYINGKHLEHPALVTSRMSSSGALPAVAKADWIRLVFVSRAYGFSRSFCLEVFGWCDLGWFQKKLTETIDFPIRSGAFAVFFLPENTNPLALGKAWNNHQWIHYFSEIFWTRRTKIWKKMMILPAQAMDFSWKTPWFADDQWIVVQFFSWENLSRKPWCVRCL